MTDPTPQPSNNTQSKPDSFKLQQFGGMLPAWSDLLLPDGQATSSLNGYLFSGRLEGWRQPKVLRNLNNTAAKMVYRVPTTTQAIANATLYFLGNPIQGDQITLGEEVYTFTATVTKAYDVLIGASAAASATNLYGAFTQENGKATNQGTLYGTGTVANPAVDQTSPVTKNILALDVVRIQVFAPAFGAAYNTTLVADSTAGARLQWKYVTAPTTTFQGGLNQTFDSSITGAATWLEFVDPETDVMRSPVVDDSFDRYYFASPSLAPQYNTRARIEAGLPPWLLGVPAPGCAPGVTVSGGGNTATLGFSTSTSSNVGTPGSNIIYLIPVTPTGAMTLHIASPVASPERIRETLASLRSAFPVVTPYLASIPLYGGMWMMACCASQLDPHYLTPLEADRRIAQRGIFDLRYFNGDVHRASLALPNFVRDLCR